MVWDICRERGKWLPPCDRDHASLILAASMQPGCKDEQGWNEGAMTMSAISLEYRHRFDTLFILGVLAWKSDSLLNPSPPTLLRRAQETLVPSRGPDSRQLGFAKPCRDEGEGQHSVEVQLTKVGLDFHVMRNKDQNQNYPQCCQGLSWSGPVGERKFPPPSLEKRRGAQLHQWQLNSGTALDLKPP